MTRGGKGVEQNQTHTQKKSPSQWLKEEYEKAKRERKNKSSIWAVPPPCTSFEYRSSILGLWWMARGILWGGGQAAEELECGGGCWLASCVTALGIYLFCFVSCLIKIKDGEKSSANKSTWGKGKNVFFLYPPTQHRALGGSPGTVVCVNVGRKRYDLLKRWWLTTTTL